LRPGSYYLNLKIEKKQPKSKFRAALNRAMLWFGAIKRVKIKHMKILAIETSCDETAIAILKVESEKLKADNQRLKINNFNILSNVVASQVKLHKKYGGVWPTLAKREHQKNLPIVLKKALKESKLLKKRTKNKESIRQLADKNQELEKILQREPNLFKTLLNFLKRYKKPKIDFIAVTIGPGLEPCLWTGVNFSKALAFWWDLKIIPVNHIEAHILVNFLNQELQTELFPAICLVVSGGHTQLVLMKNFGKYKIIGETRDDAAGECFDKTARILGLSYPGGPTIAAEAAKFNTQHSTLNIQLPSPMIHSKDYDFSFSGLKTAVLYQIKNQSASRRTRIKNKEFIREMAKEIQNAINNVLIKKTIKAAKNYKAKSIILGGGVTANKDLRKRLEIKIKKEIPNTKYFIPEIRHATDNALMIGVASYFNSKKATNWKNIKANANLRIA